MKNYMRIEFKISDENVFLYSIKNDMKTFECNISNNEINCNVYYDFNEKPLSLKSDIKRNDTVKVILMPFRIELWVNSVLKDEEWPAGNCLFTKEDEIKSNISISVSEHPYAKKIQPAVIGTFENANGWKPEENVFVGDCMPYVCDNRYHVLYLKDRHHHRSKWGNGAHQWEHISTHDFKTWEIHPMAIEITESYEGSICTGSWIKKDDTDYLFYTVRMADNSPAPIRRSISKDGYHFDKDNDFSIILSKKYNAKSARDPKVILADDCLYHMFLTTSLEAEQKGCLAHLISKDLYKWEETENPIYISDSSEQPECPDYIKYNGYYYLIFSLRGRAHYMISQKPLDGWIMPENPIIPCDLVPKGAVWNDKIIFTGFKPINAYAGTMTFAAAVNDENGILIFE